MSCTVYYLAFLSSLPSIVGVTQTWGHTASAPSSSPLRFVCCFCFSSREDFVRALLPSCTTRVELTIEFNPQPISVVCLHSQSVFGGARHLYTTKESRPTKNTEWFRRIPLFIIQPRFQLPPLARTHVKSPLLSVSLSLFIKSCQSRAICRT